MKILVVDDRKEERYLAEILLKGNGYQVETAVNGAEALEKLGTEDFDMIVSDILMPVMDGFQFCKECKEDEKLKDIPFVFITSSYTLDDDRKFALSLGAATFIIRPIEPEEFVKIIQGVFRDVEEAKKKPVVAGMKILVVEDNEASRNLLMKQLRAHGREVMAAANGVEALQQALAQPPDIIISDIKMPKMDGYQLCHECKQNDKLKDIPFVFYTAIYTKEEDEKFALSLGANSFIRKPTKPDVLVQKLREVVEKAQSGALAPAEVSPLEPSLFLTEYTKRIVAKLEDKIAQLEAEIAQRKQAEEKIKRAAEEWRTTFNSITDLVSIHDKDFKFVRVNKALADFFKTKQEELIGKHCYEVFHGTNEPVSRCPHEKTIKTKKPAIAEYFEPHLGIHLEVATSPIFNEKGEVTASVHVARDISERKRMEERLIVTDRLASIGELASGIAHELNNPLTGVIGFSDLLLARDLPDDIKEDVKIINSEAKRTAGVVRNLLTFARKHPETKEPLDINSSIEKVLELRAYEQKVNNIKVNTRFDPDLPEVMANGFELQQVFLNITINAEYFMIEAHGRGTFTITTERIDDIVRASFADDGPGIAKENLGHLFDPFFTTKEVGKGTGLGLSISYGIITEHGGRIYAESELGKGATFVTELPIATIDNEGTVE